MPNKSCPIFIIYCGPAFLGIQYKNFSVKYLTFFCDLSMMSLKQKVQTMDEEYHGHDQEMIEVSDVSFQMKKWGREHPYN